VSSFFDRRILSYVFKISPTPLRFKELLAANRVFEEGMNIENSISGFKLRLGRTYILFFVIWLLALIPVSIVLHGLLAKMDAHLLIILTALLTGSYFISFSVFREYLIEKMASKIIRKSWDRHLPLFSFDDNAKDVAVYYGEAIEEEIAIGDLQRFIFDKLASS
jgi:hypothetical protein